MRKQTTSSSSSKRTRNNQSSNDIDEQTNDRSSRSSFRREVVAPDSSRVAKFARLHHHNHNQRSQVSSTPTGFIPIQRSNSSDETSKSWPGPFSVARELIAKREEAKRNRDAALVTGQELKVDAVDHYESILARIESTTDRRSWSNCKSSAPTLYSLTVQAIARKVLDFPLQMLLHGAQDVEIITNTMGTAEDYFPVEYLRDICRAVLSCGPTLTADIASALTIWGSGYLIIPDASQLVDITLRSLISKAAIHVKDGTNILDYSGNKYQISVLEIMHAGIAFTDFVCESILQDCVEASVPEIFTSRLPSMQGLVRLHLIGLYRIHDSVLAKLLKKHFRSLRSVSLAYALPTSVSSECFRSLCGVVNLEELYLDHCPHLRDENIAELLGCEIVEHESSPSMSAVDGLAITMRPIATYHNLATPHFSVTSLQSISFHGVSHISDGSVAMLVQLAGPQNLTSLDIGECYSLSDESLIAIRRYCSHLRRLIINQLPRVNLEAVMSLFITKFQDHKSFQSEEESAYDAVNASSSCGAPCVNAAKQLPCFLNEWPESIGQLEFIDLSDLQCVNDDVVIVLCRSLSVETSGMSDLKYTSSLKWIRLHGCDSVSSRSVIALAEHCAVSLEALDVGFCRRINESSMNYLLRKCIGLRDVKLFGCTQLSTSWFKELVGKCGVNIKGR